MTCTTHVDFYSYFLFKLSWNLNNRSLWDIYEKFQIAIVGTKNWMDQASKLQKETPTLLLK